MRKLVIRRLFVLLAMPTAFAQWKQRATVAAPFEFAVDNTGDVQEKTPISGRVESLRPMAFPSNHRLLCIARAFRSAGRPSDKVSPRPTNRQEVFAGKILKSTFRESPQSPRALSPRKTW